MTLLRRHLILLLVLFCSVACKTALTPPALLEFDQTQKELLGTPLSLNDQDFVFALNVGHKKPWVAFSHHVFENQEISLASWETSELQWQKPLHHSQYDCVDMVFNSDDTEVITVSTDGLLRIFDLASSKIKSTFFEGHALTRVSISPTDTYLATGSDDGFLRIINKKSLAVVAQTRVAFGAIRGLAFESTDALLVADDMGTLHRYRLDKRTSNALHIRASKHPKSSVIAFVSHHSKGPLVTSWRKQLTLPIIKSKWASQRQKEYVSLQTTQGERQVQLGTLSDFQIGSWTFNHTQVAICDSCLPEGIDFLLPDTRLWGFRMFVNEATSVIEIESLPLKEKGLQQNDATSINKGQSLLELKRFQLPGPATDLTLQRTLSQALVTFSHQPAIRSVANYKMEQANQYPLPSPHSGALLFDLAHWQPGQHFIGHRGFTVTGSLSPNGHWVATGGWDKQLLVFDAHSGAQIDSQELSGILQKVRFSNDNKVLAVGLWGPGSTWKQNPALLIYPLKTSK